MMQDSLSVLDLVDITGFHRLLPGRSDTRLIEAD